MNEREPAPADLWYDWLLRTRHGGDIGYGVALQARVDEIRDRVLAHAAVPSGAHVADIGSGDGLVGFAILERDPTATVTFVDISPALIAYTARCAQERGVAARCRFVVASAQALSELADASVDVVTARAVIAYLHDKAAALAQCARILRPGGRISMVDPIFADRAYQLAGFASQLRAQHGDAALRYIDYVHRCGAAHLPDTIEGIRANPLTNYSERDLVSFFERVGFIDIHLRLHVDCVPALPIPWEVYLQTSPRAGAPTFGQILADRFSPDERRDYERVFRPGIEAGTVVERNTNAYLYADKPR